MKLPHNILNTMRDAARNLLHDGPNAVTSKLQQALDGLRGPAANAAQATPVSQSTATPTEKPNPSMRDINPPPGKPGAETPAAEAPASAAQQTWPGVSSAPASWAAGGAFWPGLSTPLPQPGAASATPAAFDGAAFAQDLLNRMGVPGKMNLSPFDLSNFELPGFGTPAAAPAPLADGARFLDASYRNHAGQRDYKLYIPSTFDGQRMPLVVMLHGCTQNPDDFAAGTQMNALAEEKQCFVAYPAQSQAANSSKCWNWFNAIDQQRDQGEPSIIAGITQQIIDAYPVDRRQVYVAGLSAGGAMAVIVGTLYPELYAAVGVHSGLPFAAARDLPSALAAMRSGGMAPADAPRLNGGGIPIIVFHGDRDTTVNPRNGEQLIAQGVQNQAGGKAAAAAKVDSGSVPNGHRYTRTTHRQQDGSPLGEHWVIHGAGHAWSGGSQHGSYTDGKGPDASREMLRFFETVG